MHVILTMVLVTCGLMAGCVHQQPSGGSATTNGPAAIILDNHGGYSHAGRRIALLFDGSYTDTRYSDVVGDQKVAHGTYAFDPDKSRLTLSPTHGAAETLCRVDYNDQEYWVRKQERQRVLDSADAMFRQISLRSETR